MREFIIEQSPNWRLDLGAAVRIARADEPIVVWCELAAVLARAEAAHLGLVRHIVVRAKEEGIPPALHLAQRDGGT